MGRNKDKQNEYDYHHLNSYSNGWTDNPDNMLNLKRSEHEAYHNLFWWLGIIDALKQLFERGESSLADGKVKEELRKALEDLDYKDSCKWWSKKKRR